jgi:hypothetical protein
MSSNDKNQNDAYKNGQHESETVSEFLNSTPRESHLAPTARSNMGTEKNTAARTFGEKAAEAEQVDKRFQYKETEEEHPTTR